MKIIICHSIKLPYSKSSDKSFFVKSSKSSLFLFGIFLFSSENIIAKGSRSPCSWSSTNWDQLIQKTLPQGSHNRPPAASVLLWNPQSLSHQTLYALNSRQPQAVASTQKILTAYVAFRSERWASALTTWNHDDIHYDSLGSKARLFPSQNPLALGNTVYVKELFWALLFQSSNGASLALSRGTHGETESFVADMNLWAQKLTRPDGTQESYFQNPAGLTDYDERYIFAVPARVQQSTTLDLALIAARIMQDTGFRNMLSQTGFPSAKKGEIIKTGSTRAAGRTLVAHLPSQKCPQQSISLALFGEGTPQQSQRYRSLIEKLKTKMGYSKNELNLHIFDDEVESAY
jgi:D-alanyl-D-alanine carboxypeptidase